VGFRGLLRQLLRRIPELFKFPRAIIETGLEINITFIFFLGVNMAFLVFSPVIACIFI
jgi:hypothetical protein